jgi:hypothetical protein
MTPTIDILFGQTGQTLYIDCPEGRPSSVTSVTVYEDDNSDTGDTESALGSPAIESVSLSFNAASGYSQADRTKLNLSSTTGLVRNRRYLATNAYGEREWVELERIDSSNTDAYARTPLMHDYASSDTLVSTRISATVDPTWVADSNNLSDPSCVAPRYRAVWVYTVSSVVYRAATFFNLTRYPLALHVTAQDVDQLSRGLLSRLALDDLRGAGERLIAEAHAQVRLDLWGRRLSASAQRNNDVINELVKLKSVAMVADQAYAHGGANLAQRDDADSRYWQRLEALVPNAPVQATTDGATAAPSNARLWRR